MYHAPDELKHDLKEYRELHFSNWETKADGSCRCPHTCDHKVVISVAKIYFLAAAIPIVLFFVIGPISSFISNSFMSHPQETLGANDYGELRNFSAFTENVEIQQQLASVNEVEERTGDIANGTASTVTNYGTTLAAHSSLPELPSMERYRNVGRSLSKRQIQNIGTGSVWAFDGSWEEGTDLQEIPDEFGRPLPR